MVALGLQDPHDGAVLLVQSLVKAANHEPCSSNLEVSQNNAERSLDWF